MRHFYDGQIRRYITQIMRLLSNFPVKYGDGTIKQVPVVYGDLSRQVASIINDNSENKLPSAPRISVYVTNLELDRERMSDSSFVKKTQIRERAYDSEQNEYLNFQGKNYTIEKLMPTPYVLTVNADIWASSTDQKLQLLEQILVWFNPSIEIQTTDNFVDWTSVTVVNLNSIQWSNRSVPVGTDSTIDVATITLSIPIFISPPIKVKRLGIITNIITSIFDESRGDIDKGVSAPEINAWDDFFTPGIVENEFGRKANTLLDPEMANTNYLNHRIYVDGGNVKIITTDDSVAKSWRGVIEMLPGNYMPNVSTIFLSSLDNDSVITGTFIIDPTSDENLIVNWDTDSFPQDTIITSNIAERTTVDYIIDPSRLNPESIRTPGLRLLILEDISSPDALQYPAAWKNLDGSGFFASENDIIEWNGNKWTVIFDASETAEITYVTNLNTNTQYRYNNGEWLLSIDGVYAIGTWRIDLDG